MPLLGEQLGVGRGCDGENIGRYQPKDHGSPTDTPGGGEMNGWGIFPNYETNNLSPKNGRWRKISCGKGTVPRPLKLCDRNDWCCPKKGAAQTFSVIGNKDISQPCRKNNWAKKDDAYFLLLLMEKIPLLHHSPNVVIDGRKSQFMASDIGLFRQGGRCFPTKQNLLLNISIKIGFFVAWQFL